MYLSHLGLLFPGRFNDRLCRVSMFFSTPVQTISTGIDEDIPITRIKSIALSAAIFRSKNHVLVTVSVISGFTAFIFGNTAGYLFEASRPDPMDV